MDGLTSSQKVVRKAIEKHVEQLASEKGYTVPLKCWSQEELDHLEQVSLEMEHRLFNETWTTEQEEAHEKGFALAVAEKTFCKVDTERALQEPKWKAFFESEAYAK